MKKIFYVRSYRKIRNYFSLDAEVYNWLQQERRKGHSFVLTIILYPKKKAAEWSLNKVGEHGTEFYENDDYDEVLKWLKRHGYIKSVRTYKTIKQRKTTKKASKGKSKRKYLTRWQRLVKKYHGDMKKARKHYKKKR